MCALYLYIVRVQKSCPFAQGALLWTMEVVAELARGALLKLEETRWRATALKLLALGLCYTGVTWLTLQLHIPGYVRPIPKPDLGNASHHIP